MAETQKQAAAREEMVSTVTSLTSSLDDLGKKVDDLRRNETWRHRVMRFLIVLAIIDVLALGGVLGLTASTHTTAKHAAKTLTLLEDVLSPTSCFGNLSRHSSDLRTWSIQRSINRIAHLPDPDRPAPPPKLVSPECKHLYDSFLPSLPK